MNRAVNAATEGFVESIELALTLPVKIFSAALAVLLAFVNHRGTYESFADAHESEETR